MEGVFGRVMVLLGGRRHSRLLAVVLAVSHIRRAFSFLVGFGGCVHKLPRVLEYADIPSDAACVLYATTGQTLYIRGRHTRFSFCAFFAWFCDRARRSHGGGHLFGTPFWRAGAGDG